MLFLDGLPTSWEWLGGFGHGKTSPEELTLEEMLRHFNRTSCKGFH